MSEPSRDLEQRLRGMRPHRMSEELHDAIGRRVEAPVRRPRDWPMLCALGSGLAAACVIVGILIQQTSGAPVDTSTLPEFVATTPSTPEPSAMYAFTFRSSSYSAGDNWSFR